MLYLKYGKVDPSVARELSRLVKGVVKGGFISVCALSQNLNRYAMHAEKKNANMILLPGAVWLQAFFFGGYSLDALAKALNLYEGLLNKDFYITIAKNGDKRILHLVCKRANCPHLLGLTKLMDLSKVKGERPGTIYNKVKRGDITYEYLTKSSHFPEIEQRINDFLNVQQIIQNLRNRKIIIQFNPGRAGSTIEADYLIYSKEGLQYLYLFIVKEFNQTNLFVPMSFFGSTNNGYLQNQTVYTVLDVKITPFERQQKRTTP